MITDFPETRPAGTTARNQVAIHAMSGDNGANTSWHSTRAAVSLGLSTEGVELRGFKLDLGPIRGHFVVLFLILAGSQPGHRFPEPGGFRRTRKDTEEWQLESRRTPEGPRRYARTRHRHGSGP